MEERLEIVSFQYSLSKEGACSVMLLFPAGNVVFTSSPALLAVPSPC